jgi:iron(III) transport system ATP-binding protein
MTAAIAGHRPVEQERTAYLRVTGVTKRFGPFVALKDIALEVFPGEFVCFLGPSGCGKTTLLRAIAGLDIQSTGTIVQAGRDISALPAAERDFGIVFQSYALFPNLSVADNVGYGLKSRGKSRAEIAGRVAELLALVGLPDAGAKYPAQLSGGQQQRVALARALATAPGLLLLDEPLSALDARVRVRLRQEIKALQRRVGITTIMVTHDQEEALAMADRIVVMNHGVIEQVGTPLDIYRSPRTAFVADFVGTMNFIEGVMAEAGKVRVGTLELVVPREVAARAGTKVRVCLRPEDVQLRGITAMTPNKVDVVIDAIEFLGAFGRGTMRPTQEAVAGGMSEIVADLSSNVLRDLDLAPGRKVAVALPPDRLRVFAAS